MKKSQKGFTLIELLVVIAIIGVLAIVAVPALFKNINNAKTAKLESDYNTIKSAFLAHYAENTEMLDANGGIINIGDEKGQFDSIPLNNPFGGIYSISTGKSARKQLIYDIYVMDKDSNKLIPKDPKTFVKDDSVYLIMEPAWKDHQGASEVNKNAIGFETFEKLSEDIGESMVFSKYDIKKGDMPDNMNMVYIKLAD